MLSLPPVLHQAIASALREAPRSQWLAAAQQISERYRGPRPENTATPLLTGTAEALGYAALMLPATYAQLWGAMAATAARIPDWQPATMLDLGSGPGTALWAALEHWPSLTTLAAWEREPALITLGQKLAASGIAPLQKAHWKRQDLRSMTTNATPSPLRTGDQGMRGQGIEGYDLVVIGHVLNELDAASQANIVMTAWHYTKGVLLIVEPGTSLAFPIVRMARTMLLEAGAQTIAPCPHNQPCPLLEDWCHFPQRLERPAFQKDARAASSAWEDTKFSYAAMARFRPQRTIMGRVIREPTYNKAYAEIMLCSQSGVAPQRALKRNREIFRQLKALTWGQALEELPNVEPLP